MMDPQAGRWLSPDPSGFDVDPVNRYRYCGNDPINKTDPSGRDPEDTKVTTPPDDYLDRVKKEFIKKGDEEGWKIQTQDAFGQGTAQAGPELGDHLKKLGDALEEEFKRLTPRQKLRLIESVYDPFIGDSAWDIEEMFNTEHKDFFAIDRSHKASVFKQFVTVKGDTYFAGAVNYYLWGRLNRLWFDYELHEKAADLLKWVTTSREKGIYQRPYGRVTICDDGQELIEPIFAADLHKAIAYVKFYRSAGGVTGRVWHDRGIEERVAWTQAGWFNDFKYATPYKLNSIVKPTTDITYQGKLTMKAGLDEDKNFIIKKAVDPP